MFSRVRPPLLREATPIDGVVVAHVEAGSLTHRQTAALASETSAHLDAGAELLVLDLTAVGYIDSAGLGGLVRAVKTARDAGREVMLASLQQPVRVLIEMMRLHELIDIVNTADEAVRAFGYAREDGTDLTAGGIDAENMVAAWTPEMVSDTSPEIMPDTVPEIAPAMVTAMVTTTVDDASANEPSTLDLESLR